MSSPPSVLSSMVKGGVCDSFKISNSVTSISISPVEIFKFLLLRSITFPVTFNTNSRPHLRACSHKAALVSMLKANWVIPYLSRKSIKVIPPKSRLFCNQPLKVTVVFISVILSSPQVCVLCIIWLIQSKITVQLLF